MGLLSDLRNMIEGGSGADELMQMELEQVRQRAEGAEGAALTQETTIGPKIRRRYRFVGSVQGVGFRFTTTNLATSAGATGWVMNETDGSVTAEIQGVVEQIEAVIAGLERYYNTRRFFGGFRIDSVRDVDVIAGETGFGPIY